MTNVTYDAAVPAVHVPEHKNERKGLFARMFDAMVEARMEQAHREIARYVHLVPGGLPVRCFKSEPGNRRADSCAG